MDRTTTIASDPYLGRPRRRVSWGAVLAGTVIAIMIMMLVNLLTMGMGLQSIDTATEAEPLAGLGAGTTFGVIIANVLALFFGGWVAGRVAGETRGFEGSLHGLLVWGLVTLLSFWMLSTAVGRLVGGAASAVGQGLSLVGQGASALAPTAAQAVQDALESQGVNLESMQQEAAQVLEQVTGTEAEDVGAEAGDAAQDIVQNPQAAGRRVNQLISQVFGANPSDDMNRDDVVDGLVAAGMAQGEAEQTVANWEEVAEETQARIDAARQDLEVAVEEATNAVGSAAIGAFFALLVGAVIAMLGAAAGRPKTVGEAVAG